MYGLIKSIPHPTDYKLNLITGEIVGSGEGVGKQVDWRSYLPVKEKQSTRKIKTYACVSYSALNCFEVLFYYKTGIEYNWSDRWTAVKSGTIVGEGNTFVRVNNSIRHDGIVPEKCLPSNPELVSSVKEWYTLPYKTKYKYNKAPLHWLAKTQQQQYDWKYYWVDWGGCSNTKLEQALKYSPLQITVKAWKKPIKEKGRYVYDYTDKKTNHAVMLFHIDRKGYKYIYDHYDKNLKILSPNFYIGSALGFKLTLKKIKPYFLRDLSDTIGHKLTKRDMFYYYLLKKPIKKILCEKYHDKQ